jgi:regulator of nucleoside diphosphate kinase
LGAALVGLRVGDQMPYFIAGRMNVVRIESVNRSKPDIDPLASLLRVPAFANDDDNPGPAAA